MLQEEGNKRPGAIKDVWITLGCDSHTLQVLLKRNKGEDLHPILSANYDDRTGIFTMDFTHPVLARDVEDTIFLPGRMRLQTSADGSPMGILFSDPKGRKMKEFGLFTYFLMDNSSGFISAIGDMLVGQTGRFDPVEAQKIAQYSRKQQIING